MPITRHDFTTQSIYASNLLLRRLHCLAWPRIEAKRWNSEKQEILPLLKIANLRWTRYGYPEQYLLWMLVDVPNFRRGMAQRSWGGVGEPPNRPCHNNYLGLLLHGVVVRRGEIHGTWVQPIYITMLSLCKKKHEGKFHGRGLPRRLRLWNVWNLYIVIW